MNDLAPDLGLRIASVGHSNQPLASFLELLHGQQIELVIDVRSAPYSRFAAHFNADTIEAELRHAGLSYLFLGDRIGGRPREAAFYDPAGYVLYDRLAQSGSFRDGISRLEEAARGQRVAIMCGEEDPSGCHRHLLIGHVLAKRGLTLYHIRGGGRLQTAGEVCRDAGCDRTEPVQLGLFGQAGPEERAWKSLRPVSRGGAPPNSSER